MENRKSKIKLPPWPWRHGMGGRQASLDVVDMFGKPVFDPAHPYDQEVETTQFIIHAANAVFALAEHQCRNPLEAAMDLEMRLRNAPCAEILRFSRPQSSDAYSSWKFWDPPEAERSSRADKELALN